MTKWGNHPHWAFEAVLLGSDMHGDWIGIPAGTFMSRPGAEVTTPVDQVSLVPPPGTELQRSWLATFHAPGGPVKTYVDIATPPRWDGLVLRSTDLDLDVAIGVDGRVWIEDEDEFAAHQIDYGYPPRVIATAEASCARVHARMLAGESPFDGVADAWLARVKRQR
jgi:uncharacterized protein